MSLRALASSSRKFPLNRIRVKKLFTTFVACMALLSATLKTAGDPSIVTDVSDQEDSSYSVRPGLSRTRPAFRKAIGMLADAANSNGQLAEYYQRVAKRVTGDTADAQERSATVVVKPIKRRINRSYVSSATQTIKSSDSQNEASYQPSMPAFMVASAASLSNSTADNANEETDNAGEPIRQQFTVGDMTFETNPAIERWVDYYSNNTFGRRTMAVGIERSNAYLEMARAEFRSAGVPEDLVWLACVESVWNPRALSPAAAGGIWQFIPATATEYGLKVEHGIDERADPLKQTRVAAAYLRDLYTIFGDWALAMAAYNSGEPRVMGAIVKNGNADFWELYEKQLLPKETSDYVPKILATIKLAGQAEDYGFVPQAEASTFSGS
jgi:hypothetical protein